MPVTLKLTPLGVFSQLLMWLQSQPSISVGSPVVTPGRRRPMLRPLAETSSRVRGCGCRLPGALTNRTLKIDGSGAPKSSSSLLLLPLLPLLLSVPAGAEFEGSERMPLQGVYGEYTPWSGGDAGLTHITVARAEAHEAAERGNARAPLAVARHMAARTSSLRAAPPTAYSPSMNSVLPKLPTRGTQSERESRACAGRAGRKGDFHAAALTPEAERARA